MGRESQDSAKQALNRARRVREMAADDFGLFSASSERGTVRLHLDPGTRALSPL